VPVARGTPVRLPVAGRVTMRTMFVVTLLVIAVGLTYFLTLGVLHR
jgi:hypothetical protein